MLRTLWTVALLLSLPSARLTGQTTAELLTRLNAAAQLSTLSDPAVKPWHLKTEFDLLEPNGAVREHGTLEEWWASPDQFRLSIVSTTYNATETHNGARAYRTADQPNLPDLEEALVSQVSEPLPRSFDPTKISAVLQKRPFGGVSLDCIMPVGVTDFYSRNHFGQETTYCFDPGQPDLRVVIRYREQFLIRNHVARFQDHDVALDLSVVDAGKLVLKSHTTQLSTFTPGDREFEPAANQQAIPMRPHMTPALLAGMLLTKVAPEYPLMARQNHISGVVLLRVIIGKDGRVQSLTPIRSPDKSLTTAAEQAVRQWTYKPCLLDNQPVEVETVVVVNFNMG